MSSSTSLTEEQRDLLRVRQLGWRLVMNKRRAKLLRNRGERIQYSRALSGWIWKPETKGEQL